jgi:hypothetical protein
MIKIIHGSSPIAPSHSHGHEHGAHGSSHGHGFGHDHDSLNPETRPAPAATVLQVSALLRLSGAIGLLIPLWIAVYWVVSE